MFLKNLIICYSGNDIQFIVRKMHEQGMVKEFRSVDYSDSNDCWVEGHFENWKFLPIKNLKNEDFEEKVRGCKFDNVYFYKFCYSKEYENLLTGRFKKILTFNDLIEGEL